MHPALRFWRQCAAALVLVAGHATPLLAQRLSTESHRGIDFEVGFFSYDRDRYAADFEVGVHAAAGYRVQRRGWFVEPQLRVMMPVSGIAEVCADPSVCGPRPERALDDIPTFWPSVNFGLVLGESFYSQGVVLRTAVGMGEHVQYLLGARYEGSARWFGWFVEGNAERIRWGSSDADTERRWKPALVVGARVWLRPVDVPAPGGSTDAGILANPVQPDTTKAPPAEDPANEPDRGSARSRE